MDWEPWIHFAHVAAALIWVGGGVMLSLVGVRARRSGDLAVIGDFAKLLSFAGLRVFTPAVVTVLVTGLWLVLAGSEWQIGELWVLLALVAFAAAFLIGAVYLSRSALRLQRAVGIADLAGAQSGIGQWLIGYTLVLAILLFAVWDMVFKPGTAA
jgi:uncharacterized membrane protein